MNKRKLELLLSRVRRARDGSNWQGKFTAEIRQGTMGHRRDEIAVPLDDAIKLIEAELERIKRKQTKRRSEPGRLPYADN